MPTIKCKNCSIEFNRRTHGKSKTAKYCSKNCSNIGRSKPRVLLICKNCKKEFTTNAHANVASGLTKYCSQSCSKEDRKEKIIKKSCEYCGVEYNVPLRDIHKSRFCSRQCSAKKIFNKSIEERFWEKIDKKGPDECWLFQGFRNPQGYGYFWNGKGMRSAHRYSYSTFVDKIPPKLMVLHRCDNPPCCNPNHLFVGTNDDNMKDMVKKGRSIHRNGEAHPRVKLNNEIVLKIRHSFEFDKLSHAEIGRIYNVNRYTVGDIVRRESWKHI